MVEEQGLHKGLEQVQQIVVAPDVGQLVGQERLQLVRAEAGEGAGRNQHRGPEPSHHRGHGHPGGTQEPHRPAHPDPPAQGAEGGIPALGDGEDPVPGEPAHTEPASQVPEAEERHSGQPHRDDQAEPGPGCGRSPAGPPGRRSRTQVTERAEHRGAGGPERRGQGPRVQPGPASQADPDRGEDRQGQHGQQGRPRDREAHLGQAPGNDGQRGGQEQGRRRSLPQEVEKRPGGGPAGGMGKQGVEAVHDSSPSRVSRSFRISASSRAEAGRDDSACMTRRAGDPLKARSMRSPTSWRWVSVWLAAAR